MAIQLSDHFNYRKLMRFTLPSVIMMIFTSIYGVVDGIFVSNFVGKTSFSALNLIFPVCMLLGAMGFMIGTGGSALVAKTLGEGNPQKADRIFSMLIYFSIAAGGVISLLGFLFVKPIAVMLGAEGQMLSDCVLYGNILMPATLAFILQNEFQSFLVAAEKPQLGLGIMIAAGFTNILLDALFIAVFNWGLAGAALATALSQIVGGILPLLYFIFSKNSVLHLVKTAFDGRCLLRSCINGSSEMMTNLSMSLVNILYNFQLMRIAGENGVAAYGVIMYVNFIFVAAFIGYSVGCAPIFSYHFGAQNHNELHGLFKQSLVIIAVCSGFMTVSGFLLASPLSKIFVGYDAMLFEMTADGLAIYSISFICTGFNIFGSAFFTALNDGFLSALLSFLRTLLFQVIAVSLLPLILGVTGIWFAIVAAELLALIVTFIFFAAMRPKYHY